MKKEQKLIFRLLPLLIAAVIAAPAAADDPE